MPEESRLDALITYRYLRWLLILLPSLLFVVTVLTAVQQGELETSISAYYGGPVRDVFVGCMIAIAACLFTYQGRGLEDYTLNGAGFYAVFVALVPAGYAQMMAELREHPSPDGFTPADHAWILRFALTSVLVLSALLFVREVRAGTLRSVFTAASRTRLREMLNQAFVILTQLVLVLFTVVSMVQLWAVPADQVTLEGVTLGPVQLRIHDAAALFMIISLMVAVLTKTGWLGASPGVSRTDEVAYRVILVLMAVGPLVVWAIAAVFSPDHLVIFLEWWEIVLFAVFWAKETRRLRRTQDLPTPAAGPAA